MARKRANDYDDKRQAILDRSAELFSVYGFDRASMNKIAEACGVSKAKEPWFSRVSRPEALAGFGSATRGWTAGCGAGRGSSSTGAAARLARGARAFG